MENLYLLNDYIEYAVDRWRKRIIRRNMRKPYRTENEKMICLMAEYLASKQYPLTWIYYSFKG